MRVLRTELARTANFRRAYVSLTDAETTDGTSAGAHTLPEAATEEPSHNRDSPAPAFSIRTLQPARLTSEDLLTIDLAASTSVRVTVFNPHADSANDRTPSCRLRFSQFPVQHGQRGWLYYHQPPSGPPLAGEVRFRIIPPEVPDIFALGVDAVTESGIPWCLPLPAIAASKSYAALKHILTVVDGTVSRDLMQQVSYLSRIPKRCIYAFDQPFELSMQAGTHRVRLVGKKGLSMAELRNIAVADIEAVPADKPGGGTRYVKHTPFLGTAVCAFERSTRTDHRGQRVVVVRVLRFSESDPVRLDPDYAGPEFSKHLMPREGKLLMMMHRGKVMAWVGDVDRRAPDGRHNPAASLGILFDNAIEYGLPS
ncbi:hypothetical protein K466DRAFT_599314 [Polyporus arcularius HHB13444]|uniref:Uncharacterized protein n=1 Tax=Polyporus arcularius HHB13444 TaxID=1314778 RepID=A0A5C3PFM4_9APHY|nr:hypothetical protein K466DRAFT_599314 [Polyporus arcularius HHB13444]